MFSQLQFARFRFCLHPEEPLYMPARNKGNVLRGALGTMLRRLCCHPHCPGATRCELRASCPYALIFEPGPPPDAAALSNYEAIPRPFVIRPPLEEKTRYERGESLDFGLVLVGRAIESLPYFVLAFERLGEEGFGLNRARCRLERVEQLDSCGNPAAEIFDATSRVMRPVAPASCRLPGAADVAPASCRSRGTADVAPASCRSRGAADVAPASCRSRGAAEIEGAEGTLAGNPQSEIRNPQSEIALRFLTPTHLVFEERVVREPEFHHVVRRLRDRLNALATFYCGGPLELDFKGIGERAGAVRCVRRDLRWEDRERRSSKNGRRHDVGGFMGECVFEALSVEALSEFLPLLSLGRFLHVGKHTAWGNGWIEVAKPERISE